MPHTCCASPKDTAGHDKQLPVEEASYRQLQPIYHSVQHLAWLARIVLVQWGESGTIWPTQADGVSDLTGCNSALLLLLALISTARSFLTTVITCTTEDRVNSHGLNVFNQSCAPQHDFAANCSSTAGVMLRSGHKQGHSNTLRDRHSTMKTAFELLLSWMARMTVMLTTTGIC